MDSNITPEQFQEIVDQTESVLDSMWNWEAIDKADTAKRIIQYLEVKYLEATPAYNPDCVVNPEN